MPVPTSASISVEPTALTGRRAAVAGRVVAAMAGDDARLRDDQAVAEPKLLDPALYDVAEVFFG